MWGGEERGEGGRGEEDGVVGRGEEGGVRGRGCPCVRASVCEGVALPQGGSVVLTAALRIPGDLHSPSLSLSHTLVLSGVLVQRAGAVAVGVL